MKRLLLLALLVLPATPADRPDVETFYSRLVKFDHKYGRMLATLCGWSEARPGPPACNPAEGRLDVKEFALARDAAKELFGLREPLTAVK